MSDRLLKESDVLRAIDKRIEELSKNPVFVRKNGNIDVMGVKKYILAIPSVERPRGEWIYCENEHGIDGYRCSNCGEHIAWDYQHKFINFIEDYHTCPFCDARMKGAGNETTT